MNASEFAFLAMGLALGVCAGAALMLVLRARPPVPREVRVTVIPDAIPRRAATLANDGFAVAEVTPGRGGPADRSGEPGGTTSVRPDRRTPVLVPATMGMTLAASGAASAGPGARIAIPVRADTGRPIAEWEPASAAGLRRSSDMAGAVAVLERPSAAVVVAAADTGGNTPTDDPGSGPGMDHPISSTEPTGPCAEQRRMADERCELAGRARATAGEAEAVLRSAQRDFNDHAAMADQATEQADPRAIRLAKEAAQKRFRAARARSGTTEEVEAAARDWLSEINRINTDARDAIATSAREQEAVRRLTLELDRIAMETEAARIAAETAEAACLTAREAVAACEEAAADPARALVPPPPPASDGDDIGEPDRIPAISSSGGTPRILRLVRGDRAAMTELVVAMAGDDPDARRQWQMALANLIDAILADSIAAGSLDFPTEHPFWGQFSNTQNREIAGALASLGYRFDGLGGWVDARTPSQRDLSLALGYAGVDPMRIRQWPTEAEMAQLFSEVSVAADERLSGAAGDLTLGELVTMLGRRADALAEVWNNWGTLRPLLLEES